MDKKKVVALVAAVSAFLVAVVPLVAELLTNIIENLKGAVLV